MNNLQEQEFVVILNNIKNIVSNNGKVFYSFTGPNGIGKTTILNKIKNEFIKQENFFVFHLNNEIILENELKENKSQIEFKAQLRKFLHDSLIKKVALYFFELSNSNDNISILFSTHSSYLINEITNLFKNNNNQFNCFKVLNKEIVLDISSNLFDIELNTRELNIICKSIFDEYIVLVEGINDYEFANLICIDKFNNYFFNVYDCGGKNGVKKLCEKIRLFNDRVFCFFDKDYKKKSEKDAETKSNQYRDYYINNNINYYEFDDNIEDFFENEINKKEFAKEINIKRILQNKNINKVLESLKYFFMH